MWIVKHSEAHLLHLPCTSEIGTADVVFQARFARTLTSLVFIRSTGIKAWTRGWMGETGCTSHSNNKHVSFLNSGDVVTVTSTVIAAGFAFVDWSVYFNLERKQSNPVF